MAYHPILYRVLGVPDTGAEPTPYLLLAVPPERCTPETVRERLAECTKRIRQNIPGPQFIPIVALWERELAQAAAVLADPRKRAAWDARAAGQARKAADGSLARRREDAATTVRQAVDAAVARDGTLDAARRRALKRQLRTLHVPRRQIKSSLAEIPRPMPDRQGPAAGARAFLERATDMSLGQGLLTAKDEQALLNLAAKIQLPPETAAALIEARVKARGAKRVQGDRAAPSRGKSVAPGGGAHAAAAAPAAAGGLPAGVLPGGAGAAWDALALPRRKRRLWPYLIPAVAAVLFALAVAGILYLSTRSRRRGESGRPAAAPTVPAPADSARPPPDGPPPAGFRGSGTRPPG